MNTVASAVPLGVTIWMLHAFAGRTTDLKLGVVVSASGLANLTMAVSLHRKNRATADQSAELNRLRGRLEAFEGRTGSLVEPRSKRGGRAR